MAQNHSIPKANVASTKIPTATSKKEDPLWTFSFEHWTQEDFFGLEVSKCDGTWFASLLSKLKELSGVKIDKFMKSDETRNYWRFHKIDFSKKNVPLSKEKFWELLPEAARSDETDICQFMISLANGRVVGYFDASSVFNIVLLDPLHNIQPSKSFDYAVNPTGIKLTHIEEHRERLKLVKKNLHKHCEHSCEIKEKIDELMESKIDNRFFCLNDFLSEDEIQLLINEHKTIDDAIYVAISTIMPKS